MKLNIPIPRRIMEYIYIRICMREIHVRCFRDVSGDFHGAAYLTTYVRMSLVSNNYYIHVSMYVCMYGRTEFYE